MTRKTGNKDMRKWPGILLLLVWTPTAQLQVAAASTHQQDINTTHGFSNVSSENDTNWHGADRKVGTEPTLILNNDNSDNSHGGYQTPSQFSSTSSSLHTRAYATITTSKHDIQGENHPSTIQDAMPISTRNAHIIRDKKLDMLSNKNSVPQILDVIQRPLTENEKHESILSTELNAQDNNDDKLPIENDEKSSNTTASITSIMESTNNDSVISLMNDTIVNNYGVPIEQSHYVIILKNVTTPVAENATNITPKLINVVEKSKNSEEQTEILEPVSSLSKESQMMNIKEDTGLVSHIETTMTHHSPKNIINHNNFDATTPTLKNITSSTERIESRHDRNDFVPRARTITFGDISHFSDTDDQEIRVMNKTKLVHPHENNDNNNNAIKNPIGSISSLENTIGKSHDDEKIIITTPSIIIDDNSIQQINQSTYYNKHENSSTSNLTKLSGIPVKHTILKKRNNSNSSSTMELDVNNAKNNIPHNVDESDVLVEKRSSLDLFDNGLHEAVEKNSTNSGFTLFTGITPVNIPGNTTTVGSDLNESLPITYSDIRNYTQDLKSIIPPINVTTDPTRVSQPNDTYLSSTIPSFPIMQSSPNSLSLTTLSPTSTTLDYDAPTSAITTNEIAAETSIAVTTPSSMIVNPFPTSDTVQIDDSSRRASDSSQTTTTNVEYEFVGLNATKNGADENDTHNSSTTTVAMSSKNLSSTTPDSPDIDESVSTMDDAYVNTTEHPTVTSLDYDDDTTSIVDETTTLSPSTATFTYYPFISSPITPIDGELSVTGSSEESTISDISDTTAFTTTIVSSSSTLEYDVEAESSSTITDSTTALDTEDSSTISTIPMPSDKTRLVPEDVTVLVKMVVQTNWSDMCPQLSALKQALADVLSAGVNKIIFAHQIVFRKNPCTDDFQVDGDTTSVETTIPTTFLLYIVNQDGDFDETLTKILPSLYRESSLKLKNVSIRSIQLVEDFDSGNAIAVIVVSCVAFICLVLLASLLFVMRKRQTRFNYGERCRPVSLDAYSLDSVSAYNSVRRKGAMRMSKRSYGNPAFEDSSAIPSHPLNFAGLSAFYTQQTAIFDEFASIPQSSARIDELPNGAEVKNRYANVIPLPETRVPLMKINNDPLTEYINASYIRGPKNALKYYIGCQAPIESTVVDFWRMIWEQQSKVIIMLTDLIENGVEKCVEYIPASEVTDCHRLYGDFQVTLKKRETKEKYAISTLHLKNLVTNTYREISHIWYLWPANGIQIDAAGLIAVLLEARAVQRGDPGPIVVHCSPGTGRTGTLIALDLGIRQYEITRTVDVPRVVYTIRRDRAGAVQTKEQYCFIYKALNFYATKLAGGGLEST